MKENTGMKLKDFKLFEAEQIPVKGNRVGPTNEFLEFSKEHIEQSIGRRFEEQVRKYPHHAAVKLDDHLLTYEALNGHANRAARVISSKYDDRFRLTHHEKIRYTRQMMLQGWGVESQERLKSAIVFVAGAGGSGSPLIMQLALLGIGTIIICDHDDVELSNLNRQVLHDESRIGMNKALSAKISVQKINPHVNVIAYPHQLNQENVYEMVGPAEIIFDNVDDMEAKFLLSQCAAAKQIPHIISSMIDLSSYAAIFYPPQTPCFHCLYDRQVLTEIEELKNRVKNYQKKPNPVATPSLFQSTGFAVNEAVKILLGFGTPAYNKYFFFNQRGSQDITRADGYRMITYPFSKHFRDLCKSQGFDWDTGWSGRFVEEIEITPDPNCPLCAGRGNLPDISHHSKTLEPIDIEEDEGTAAGSSDRSQPVGSLPTVALLFRHSVEMIVGILGALKAGKAYVPLDATYPSERLEFMLADSDCRLMVTDTENFHLAQKLRNKVNKRIQVIVVNDIDENIPAGNLEIDINPGDLAYILYTSGSTGNPKGVMQNHRNVLHFCRVYTNALHINSQDRLTLFSSYGFDAAKMDIFGALLNGAALYPYEIKREDSLERLPAWLQDEKITIFHSIPTVYRYFTGRLAGDEIFPYIRLIVMGGEAVYRNDVEEYKRHFTDECLFINGLGPTESTVTLQYFIDKTTPLARESVPVGYPAADTRVFLINEYEQEAQVFEVGEIVFKSDYLALGYLNQREKTREVFVTDPLTGEGRVYRTGDLGRRLPDGTIEYVGRKDFQVKIRGYRVELGEIEARLDQEEGIQKSIIVCQERQKGENRLVAYYTTNQEHPANEMHLVRNLKKSLPDYMIPNAFYPVDTFPLTPTGKIDRKVLTSANAHELEKRIEYIEPQTDREKQIAALWKQVLKADKVGIHDNFFELGGHSLTMIQLNSELKKLLKKEIPMVSMLRYPTISTFVKYLAEGEFETIISRSQEKKLGKSRLSKIRNRKKETDTNAVGN